MVDDIPAGLTRCDLCGAHEVHTVVALPTPRALRSDRAVVDQRLSKVSCSVCGLVRNAAGTPDFAEAYYRAEYEVAAADYRFYTAGGPVARSTLMADWIVEGLGAAGVERDRIATVLEIGAGAGAVVTEISGRLPDARCGGVELSAAASGRARAQGIAVENGDVSAIPSAAYDLVYAVAVLEHVPSPTAFLGDARRVLKAGGHLVLVQPTQDVPSYDILFVDHLHHFGTSHLAAYASKCGFLERGATVGHRVMSNFSLHVWQAVERGEWQWVGPPGRTTCAETARQVMDDMRRVDLQAAQLNEARRPFAAFGLNEVFALARAYSCLETRGLRCGLDDEPDKPEYRRYGFPVVAPERCLELGVADVFLTMNKIYYEQASARLARLGLVPRPVLS